MASSKSYGYYIKGNKIAIVQRNSSSSATPNEDYGDWKSPTEDVADGIELQYAYGPKYWINELSDTTTGTGFDFYNDNGVNRLQADGAFTFAEGDYFVIKGSERFDGLHKVANAVIEGSVETTTKYNGPSITEESFTVYNDVNPLNNETDDIDLPSYLTKALVYYVKARLAEDRMDEEREMYYMRKYIKILEQYENSKIKGPRVLMGFGMRT